MSALYRIDQDLFLQTLLPPNKRTSKQISWLKALNGGMEWLNEVFNEYIDGAIYPYYSGATTYNKGDRVDGSPTNNNYIYESLTDSNTGNPLTDTVNWIPILTSQLGVSERKMFTANKMCFEYALNQYFRTNFRQPTGATAYGLRSDIYIDDNTISINSLFIGVNPPLLYPIEYFYSNRSDGFIIDGTYFYSTYQYTIYTPNSLLSAYGSDAVKNIAEKYNQAPLQYQIVGY